VATHPPHPEPPAPLALRTDHEQVIVRRSGVSWRAEWPQILWRALPSNSSQSTPIPRDPNHKPVLHTETHVFMERSVAKRSVSKDGNAQDRAAAIVRCMGTVPVATLRDTPLRSIPR